MSHSTTCRLLALKHSSTQLCATISLNSSELLEIKRTSLKPADPLITIRITYQDVHGNPIMWSNFSELKWNIRDQGNNNNMCAQNASVFLNFGSNNVNVNWLYMFNQHWITFIFLLCTQNMYLINWVTNIMILFHFSLLFHISQSFVKIFDHSLWTLLSDCRVKFLDDIFLDKIIDYPQKCLP